MSPEQLIAELQQKDGDIETANAVIEEQTTAIDNHKAENARLTSIVEEVQGENKRVKKALDVADTIVDDLRKKVETLAAGTGKDGKMVVMVEGKKYAVRPFKKISVQMGKDQAAVELDMADLASNQEVCKHLVKEGSKLLQPIK